MADNTTPKGNQLVSFFHDPPKKNPDPKPLGIKLLPIGHANSFTFQGPAVAGIVYVSHPLNPSELIVFADYDERLAQDRYEEALRVFTSLGAARIVATSKRQTTKTFGAKFGLNVNNLAFHRPKDAIRSLAFSQEGDGGPPIDPRPLRFRDVPGLEQVCEGVLHNGWKKARIQITKSATLGVDGELAIKLKRAGFKLGVSGSKVTATEFDIEALSRRRLGRISTHWLRRLGVGPRHISAFVTRTQPCVVPPPPQGTAARSRFPSSPASPAPGPSGGPDSGHQRWVRVSYPWQLSV